MNKKLLLLTLPFALSNVNAQTSDVRFGFTGGLNNSTLTGLDSKIGFNVGVKAELAIPSLNKNIYLEAALLYSAKGAKLDFGDLGSNKINANYLEIPIHVGYKFKVNPDLSVLGSFGPYFAYGIGGKMKISELDGDIYGNFYNDEYINTESDTFSKSGGLDKFDVGLGFKVGAELKNKYQLSIGYDFGLKNIYNRSVYNDYYYGDTYDYEIDATGNLKTGNLKISLAYMF